MDFAAQRKMELEIDELLRAKETDVLVTAKEAKEALKARNWDKATKLTQKARSLVPKKTSVSDFLVNEGHFQTRAMANRAILNGQVVVDGVVSRRIDQDVTDAKTITVGPTQLR